MKLGEHKTKIKTQKKLVLLKTAWQHTRPIFKNMVLFHRSKVQLYTGKL